MASKVPKFGAWEGGENFTVYFDNARKTKNNGQKINPNDPEENPDLFRQIGGAGQAPPSNGRGLQQGKQTKVPQFGAWEGGENVGYTAYFETARKTNTSGPVVSENEPQLNRDMPSRSNPPVQTRPAIAKTEPQEARSKLPQFGQWENGGEVGYTAAFDNLKKKKHDPKYKEEPSKAPQKNRDGAPPPQEGRAKVPQFGAWNGDEPVAYTACFDNARKTKNVVPGSSPIEPQLNQDVVHRPRHPATKNRSESREEVQFRDASRSTSSATGSEASLRQGRQAPVGQPAQNTRVKLQPKAPPKGSQTPDRGAAIPQFGGWHNDPSQADGYTTAFTRAKEERATPHHSTNPPSYQQQSHYRNQQQPKACCSIL